MSLLLVSCGVPKEDYEAVVAERDAAQIQVESLQSDLATTESDLAAARSTIEVQEQTLAKAEAFAEVLSTFFFPLITEEVPEPVVVVLTRLSDPVKATEDPELERLYNALVDSQGGDQESRDFVNYLLEELQRILD